MNNTKIFGYLREQKAFTAFLTTLMVIGSFSAILAAPFADAEVVFLSVTDTLSTSEPSADAKHTIKFTTVNPIVGTVPGDPLNITFHADFAVPAFAFGDVSMTATGETYVAKAACDASAGTYTVSVAGDVVSINLCQAATIPSAKEITLTLGTGATKITNPAAVDDYEIILDNPATNQSQKIRVVTVDKVLMTAAVDPILSFTVSGTASGTAVNGATANTVTTSSAIDFLTLVPNEAKIAAQLLDVSTNARNGFIVTARTDSDFKSANGATIDGFNFAGASSTPSAWADPAGLVANDRTWGHVALTSSDITDTIITGANLWVGNFLQSPVTVMSEASSTRNKQATVGYEVMITDLQEAATDYKTNMIYVATPSF